MPSRPKFTGFCEHNRALGRERFAEQDSIDAGDKPHKRFPSRLLVDPPPAGPGWLHALALLVGQEAVMLRGGSRSICRRALIDGEAGCEATGKATSARS